MPESPGFRGIPQQGLDFLSGLASDNSRSFFEAHQEVYKRNLQQPMRDLVTDLGVAVKATISDGLQAEAKVGRSLFRINRDLRFSKDKTPYNPWVDAVFWEGSEPRRSPSLILRIAGDFVITGAGIMGMSNAPLESYRHAVAADSTGGELEHLLAEIRQTMPDAETSQPRWARVPADFPTDHPRAELLRCDTLHCSIREATPQAIQSADFTEWLLDRYRRFAPLHRWLVKVIN